MSFVSRYHETVKDLLDMLKEKGFITTDSYDGGDRLVTDDTDKMASFLTQVDESNVYLTKGDHTYRIYIVLGNDYSEIACDYSYDDSDVWQEFSATITAHYDKWEIKQKEAI